MTEVQAISRDELKASVLGAYERGKRAISITRLQRLANLYGVPVAALLPGAPVVAGEGGQLMFDLAWLLVADGPEAEVLRRYLAQLQVERGGLNGRVLSAPGRGLTGRGLGARHRRGSATGSAHRAGHLVDEPPCLTDQW